jgi:hypothetical protein
VVLEGWGEEDDISISESVCEVEFIVSSEDEIEIEAFGCGCSEVSDEAGVGLVVYFAAELFILIEDLRSDDSDITHL